MGKGGGEREEKIGKMERQVYLYGEELVSD